MEPKDATNEWSRRNSAFHQELTVVLEKYLGQPKGQETYEAISKDVSALMQKHQLDDMTEEDIRDLTMALMHPITIGLCGKCLTLYSNARGGCDVCNDWA